MLTPGRGRGQLAGRPGQRTAAAVAEAWGPTFIVVGCAGPRTLARLRGVCTRHRVSATDDADRPAAQPGQEAAPAVLEWRCWQQRPSLQCWLPAANSGPLTAESCQAEADRGAGQSRPGRQPDRARCAAAPPGWRPGCGRIWRPTAPPAQIWRPGHGTRPIGQAGGGAPGLTRAAGGDWRPAGGGFSVWFAGCGTVVAWPATLLCLLRPGVTLASWLFVDQARLACWQRGGQLGPQHAAPARARAHSQVGGLHGPAACPPGQRARGLVPGSSRGTSRRWVPVTARRVRLLQAAANRMTCPCDPRRCSWGPGLCLMDSRVRVLPPARGRRPALLHELCTAHRAYLCCQRSSTRGSAGRSACQGQGTVHAAHVDAVTGTGHAHAALSGWLPGRSLRAACSRVSGPC